MGEGLRVAERELGQFPVSVQQAYQRAVEMIGPGLKEEELLAWAQEGVAIAMQTVRSWEAASEYFRASPEVHQVLPFPHLIQWAQRGASLCKYSPTISVAYFRASTAAVEHLGTKHMAGWAGLGGNLYNGTWKSSALCAKFFELSPDLMRHLSFRELELFAALVAELASRSYELAGECLHLGQRVFPQLDGDREAVISLASALVKVSWREVKACFEAAAQVSASVEASQRTRLLALAERSARRGMNNVSTFLSEGAQALAKVGRSQHRTMLDLCEVLTAHSLEAGPAFLRCVPAAVERVGPPQLEVWFREGLRILLENEEGGIAYFRLESGRSLQVLDSLSSSLELEKVQPVMRMYCRALAGATVNISATQELVDKGIGWVWAERPATDGTQVFLPPIVDRYPTKQGNFEWYKVVATHQVAHLEFGSFEFQFDRPAVLFAGWRPRAASGELGLRTSPEAPPPENTQDTSAERGWITDMSRFFTLFQDRRLALDIFTVLEDSRLDSRVKYEYRGIVPPYERVQGDALVERPPMEEMPIQQAMVELLVRLSLGQSKGLSVPFEYLQEARVMAAISRRVQVARATVEDTAEATIRIYSIISRLPNQELPEDQWETEDFEQEEQKEYSDEELERLLAQLGGRPSQTQELGEQEVEVKAYESPPAVEYRGDFKPEMGQLMAKLKQTDRKAGEQSRSMTREELEQLLKQNPELELKAEQGDIQQSAGLFANNIMREAGIRPPNEQQGTAQGQIPHDADEGGPLESKDPLTFIYNEWDFRADDYKPRWCIVREKPLIEGEVQFFNETLRAHAGLVNQIRRQFEMLIPESFRKIKRLNDGEDVDLDAAIEAVMDRRTGVPPSEKLYWRRNKVQRDVAAAFLLDMSASTAEAVDDSKRLAADWDAPDDPVEYMVWLRTRRVEGARRSYKRIVDVEKESMVLLTNALESIGDVYGIFGFSGYGRENVEFYVIKDMDEGFSERIKRRMDKIAPLHATRMGPAIRHATSKLERHGARTRFLFLISDGRPQDRGYSREGVEKEYAIHDTKMALMEAKRKGITPFCLTVDKQGHDYLKTMCQDMAYEVLDDIRALPERLLYLYRRLTV